MTTCCQQVFQSFAFLDGQPRKIRGASLYRKHLQTFRYRISVRTAEMEISRFIKFVSSPD
jgi:hypothetical protein